MINLNAIIFVKFSYEATDITTDNKIVDYICDLVHNVSYYKSVLQEKHLNTQHQNCTLKQS